MCVAPPGKAWRAARATNPPAGLLPNVCVYRSGKFLAGGVLAAFLLFTFDGYRVVLD